MAGQTGFYYSEDTIEGCAFITLGYRDGHDAGRDCAVCLSPSMGSNLCRLSYGPHKIIDADLTMVATRGFPGTPVLYPTPNRMRNGQYEFMGKTYSQVKRGKVITLHGLVQNEPWHFEKPEADDDSARLKTWIDIDESTAMFEAFPFRNRLTIQYTLGRDGIRMDYRVDNLGDGPLPYGFGLHPFFNRLSGDDDTLVSIPAQYIWENTEDLLPTGKRLDVTGTAFDVRQDTPIGATDMDHVFTGVSSGQAATITFRTLGFKLLLESTPEFGDYILFSPKGRPIFCLENQTCCTDAINMYSKGYARESGLIIVPAGESATGMVRYRIADLAE
jgi:aldose 1-epimerase